jgi:serine phosphatase RsbU (regulator of sigma subunit)/anti-sigma regulatory factor (Ser/Thr protein kinase)
MGISLADLATLAPTIGLTTLAWTATTLGYAALALAVGRWILWRRPVASPLAVFAALALMLLGVSNVMLENDPFADRYAFVATPVKLVFFLVFCAFPDGRFVLRERPTLRTAIIFFYSAAALHLPAALVTLKNVPMIPLSNQNQGGDAGLFDIANMAFLALVLIPSLRTYRDIKLVGVRLRAGWLALGALSGVMVLGISAWFNVAHSTSVVFFFARTLWYLLATLAPVALGLSLLRARIPDRATAARHTLIIGTLALAISILFFLGIGLGVFEVHQLFPDPRLAFLAYSAIVATVISIPFLYQPLRFGIIRMIDGLFYPRLHAATQRFAAFGAAAYDDSTITTLSDGLLAQVEATLHPKGAALLVRMDLLDDVAPLPRPKGQRAPSAPNLPLRLAVRAAVGAASVPAALEIASDDPLQIALVGAETVLDLRRFAPASPAAAALLAYAIGGALALVDRGEVVGVLCLSEYPAMLDLRERLAALGNQVAPVVRVAERLFERETQTRQRERVEQELQVARRIQLSFLPQTVPEIAGWHITPTYQPAREVGGDFYDFLRLADGRLGVIIGDVTGKGVPAALVMATTRSMLRIMAQQSASPGAVLAQVNEALCPDLPPNMFVTCFYAILEPTTGRLNVANAGHELPLLWQRGQVREVQARGMPLGLMPGMRYEEHTVQIPPSATVLFYSDGVEEAHSRQGEMFGGGRLAQLVSAHASDGALNERILAAVRGFTPTDGEQEDDITMVTLHREGALPDDAWRVLDEWDITNQPGAERAAMLRVGDLAASVGVPPARREQLATAVAEAILNALEHGNAQQPDLPVQIQVRAAPGALAVRVSDAGAGVALPLVAMPDLTAKLAGEQSPRGWGLFLMQQMVDQVRVVENAAQHTLELLIYFDAEVADGAATM